MPLKLNYISSTHIDYYRWNKHISETVNASVGAYTWFLDALENEWGAFISHDFGTLVPLFVTQKRNNVSVVTPPFSGQLGVFSKNALTQPDLSYIADRLYMHFKNIEYHCNKFYRITDKRFLSRERNNYELDLIQPYKKTRLKYSDKILKTLENQGNNYYHVINGLQLSEFMQFVKSNNNVHHLTAKHLNTLQLIVTSAIRYRAGQLLAVHNNVNNLCATAFITWARNKLQVKFLSLNTEAIENNVIYLLLDNYIKNASEKNIILSIDPEPFIPNNNVLKEFGAMQSESQILKKRPLNWWRKLKQP